MTKRNRNDEIWCFSDETELKEIDKVIANAYNEEIELSRLMTEAKKIRKAHEKRKKELFEKKKRAKHSPAYLGNGKYDLETLGKLIKTGNMTKEDFEKFFNDNDKLIWENESVLDFIIAQDQYNDCMFCVFFDFVTNELTDYDLDEYDRLMKDPNKINLYAK